MDKKRVFKDFFVYSAGNYISQALGMVSGFLLRVFLDPYQMGIWQGFNIIRSYTSYTNLGVSRSAAREIAYYRGKGEGEKGEDLKNTGFTFSIIMISIAGLLCVAYALLRKPYMDSYVYWGLIAVGLIIILVRIEGYILIILRAKKKFFAESVNKVATSVLNLALIVFIVRNFELFGLYAAHVIVFSGSILLLFSLSGERFRFSFNKKDLKHLIKVGIPLVLMGIMFVNLTNVDRIVILRMLGATELGLYSIAIMMGNAMYNIANMAGIVLYPRFQEVYGRNDSREEVFGVMMKIIKFVWMPFIGLALGGVFLAPYLVRAFTPKYVTGITAMQIFLCGIYFLSMSKFCSHFLVTINRQLLSLYICVFTVIVNLVLNVVLVKMGFGIEGVAGATSISYLIYFILLFAVSFFIGRGGYEVKAARA